MYTCTQSSHSYWVLFIMIQNMKPVWTYLACMYGKSITGAPCWLSSVSAVNRTF